MDLDLKNKTALVCGASQGLGLAIAEALAREGCKVGLLARNAAKLDAHVKAFAAEGLTYEEIGFSASTHHLRASLGGELKLQLAIDDLIRSEILGHLVRSGGGAAVTGPPERPADG